MKKQKFYCEPRKFAAMRHKLGFTQAKAAAIIGVRTLRISAWECGRAPVPQAAVVIYDLLTELDNPGDYRAPGRRPKE